MHFPIYNTLMHKSQEKTYKMENRRIDKKQRIEREKCRKLRSKHGRKTFSNGSVLSIINKKKGQYINLLISPGKERWYTWSRWEPLWQNMQNGFIWEAVL